MQVHETKRPSADAPRPELYSRRPDPAAVEAMLAEWMAGDPAEQRETLEILKHSLDEGRLEGYKIFP
jgi:hypothetical protein